MRLNYFLSYKWKRIRFTVVTLLVGCASGATEPRIHLEKGPILEALNKKGCQDIIDSLLLRKKEKGPAHEYYRCLDSYGSSSRPIDWSYCKTLDHLRIEKLEIPFIDKLVVEYEIIVERVKGGRRYFFVYRKDNRFGIFYVESYGMGSWIGYPRLIAEVELTEKESKELSRLMSNAIRTKNRSVAMDGDFYQLNFLNGNVMKQVNAVGVKNNISKATSWIMEHYFNVPKIVDEPINLLFDCKAQVR